MVDTELFWYKIKVWCAKMADRASDYVYTDESKETVNIINLLLLAWILFGLVVYIVGNVIATQLKKRKAKNFAGSVSPAPEEPSPCTEEPVVLPKTPLSTQSGLFSKGDDFNHTLPLKTLHAPVCSGDDVELVDWINSVLSWIYNHRVVSPVLDSWLSALNARTRLSSAEHGILVDFQSIVPSSEPPVITEAFESVQSDSEVNVACQIEALKLTFQILVTQVKENNKNIYPFILHLNRLAGQLNVECNPKKLSAVGRFSENPQVQLDIQQASEENSLPPEDYEPLRNLVSEIASDAFASSIVECNFSSYPECPRYKTPSDAKTKEKPAPEDQKERLLVKIIKASNLGTSQGSTKPYCVVEMDEPPQRFETTPVDDAACPFWDESFIFVLKDTSAELLFEIYDKNLPDNENFLGLCIVSVEELVKNPSQRQIIPLQSRPLEKDNITGTLTAEFLFMDRDIPTPDATQLGQIQGKSDGANKVIETNSRVTAGGTIITTTTIKRTTEGNSEKPSDVKTIQNGGALGLIHSRQNFLKQMIEDSSHDLSDFELPSIENNNVPKATKTDDHLLDKTEHASTEIESVKNNTVNDKGEDVSKIGDVLSNGHLLNGVIHVENSVENDIKDLSNTLHDQKEYITNVINTEEKAAAENDKKLHASADDIANEELTDANLLTEDPGLSASSSTIVDPIQHDAEEITETALKELEKPGKPGSTNKSMLIIHSVQRAGNSGSESLEASPITHPSADSQSSHTESLPSSPSHLRNGVDRSRPKVKKSLIGNLRKKLSFRKPRSRSMEAQERLNASPVPSAENNRSVSSDRMKSGPRDTSSLRSGRKYLAVAGSSRSSFSEASGVSTASSRTYINENSTLVIEINENGIIKRYLIPTSMIHRSKWKKKGIKLHLYNDHVFIAKHLSGTTLCQVCKKYLTRRPGKQGYQCRDCNLQCHKSCHVKVPEYCPNSSVTSMEVEYVHDPRLTKPKSA